MLLSVLRVAVCLNLLIGFAYAQPDMDPEPVAVAADRPGWTTPTTVVAPGLIQIESGLLMTVHSGNGRKVNLMSAPTPLIRIGIHERVELRWSTDGGQWESNTEKTQNAQPFRDTNMGWADSVVSAKVLVSKGTRFSPAIAVVPGLSEPTGQRYFSAGSLNPSLLVVVDKNLPRGWNAGMNVLILTQRAGGKRARQDGFSFTGGHGLPGGWNWESEAFGVRETDGTGGLSGDLKWIFANGFAKPLGKRAQVDFYIGRSISPVAPDWMFGVGFVQVLSRR